jgi:hypothetical protein
LTLSATAYGKSEVALIILNPLHILPLLVVASPNYNVGQQAGDNKVWTEFPFGNGQRLRGLSLIVEEGEASNHGLTVTPRNVVADKLQKGKHGKTPVANLVLLTNGQRLRIHINFLPFNIV